MSVKKTLRLLDNKSLRSWRRKHLLHLAHFAFCYWKDWVLSLPFRASNISCNKIKCCLHCISIYRMLQRVYCVFQYLSMLQSVYCVFQCLSYASKYLLYVSVFIVCFKVLIVFQCLSYASKCLLCISVFIVCWSPYFIFNLCQVYGVVPNTTEMIKLSTFIQSMAPLNSAANPVIYGIFSTRICKYLR